MKAVLLGIGVLAVAAVFAWFEPANASTQSVTSDDVLLVSEETSPNKGPSAVSRMKNGNAGRRSCYCR